MKTIKIKKCIQTLWCNTWALSQCHTDTRGLPGVAPAHCLSVTRIHAGYLVQHLGTVSQDGVEFQEAIQSLVKPVQLLVGKALKRRKK